MCHESRPLSGGRTHSTIEGKAAGKAALFVERNMDELIKTIVEKTGITEEAARGIVDEVVAFAKSKVPGPFQHFVDQIFEREE